MTKRASDIKYTGGSNETGSSVQRYAEDNHCPGESSVRIRAAVFFDGTFNNRTNVRLGLTGMNKGASYTNDLSNIAILEANWNESEEADYCFSVYVEGIGTSDGKLDFTIVAATGDGLTGIVDKVEVGIERVMSGIARFASPEDVIESITLDCFGFSRGAAAARHFIYAALLNKCHNLKQQLTAKGYSVNDVKVKFVGLFDCVVSYGSNHTYNPDSLHLDAIRLAEQVVQLAAADEHRKHFPLTTIDSAPNRVQVFLPGAHSDVGGGYADNMDEIDLQVMDLDCPFGPTDADRAALRRERRWLVNAGWCHEEEIQATTNWNELKMTRTGISNHYSRIPLKMMAQYANEAGILFKHQMLLQYRVPSELEDVEAEVVTSSASSPEHWLHLYTDIMQKLRRKYLHFSAFYGSTCGSNEPAFTDNDPVHGSRRRRIING